MELQETSDPHVARYARVNINVQEITLLDDFQLEKKSLARPEEDHQIGTPETDQFTLPQLDPAEIAQYFEILNTGSLPSGAEMMEIDQPPGALDAEDEVPFDDANGLLREMLEDNGVKRGDLAQLSLFHSFGTINY